MQQKNMKSSSYLVSGRDRLMETARDLFMRRGASNVGINDVTAAAGVARMTLYNNFPSKEALVVAVYEELAETALVKLRQMDTGGRSEEQRILDLFDKIHRLGDRRHFRGCPLIHASLQDAEPTGRIYAMVRSYKAALREHVFGLLDDGRKRRAELADQIVLLLDGAETERYLKGVANATSSAKRAAVVLLRFTESLGLTEG